jgi:hypothetical protein
MLNSLFIWPVYRRIRPVYRQNRSVFVGWGFHCSCFQSNGFWPVFTKFYQIKSVFLKTDIIGGGQFFSVHRFFKHWSRTACSVPNGVARTRAPDHCSLEPHASPGSKTRSPLLGLFLPILTATGQALPAAILAPPPKLQRPTVLLLPYRNGAPKWVRMDP